MIKKKLSYYKVFIILIWFLLFILECSDAPVLETTTTERTVLAEFFTFARCVYCPYAEQALDSLKQEYEDTLAIIAYHRRVAGDTLSPVYVETRESLYTISTSPTVVFDGTNKVINEDPTQNYPTYKNNIIAQRNIVPKIDIDYQITKNNLMINCSIEIITLDSLNAGSDYRLFLALCEDSVYFGQIGAPDSLFNAVLRKLVPDEYGESIELSYPDTCRLDLHFSLQPQWQVEHLHFIIFVQDLITSEVLQAKNINNF